MTFICIAGVAVILTVLIVPSVGLYVSGLALAFLIVFLAAELLGKV